MHTPHTPPRQRVLLTGAQSQLGRALQALAPAHWEVMACGRTQLDITCARQVRQCVQAFAPHCIINAAAYNAVDAAQTDPAAWRVNAQGPGILAHAACAVGARLLHVSTDYVFDGCSEMPYREPHPPQPLNRYGASKLAGERAVLLEQPEALVVRTSWLFSETGNNFVRQLVAQLDRGQPLRVANTQHSAPTYAGHLAAAIIRLLDLPPGLPSDLPRPAGGIYHYRDTPDISRYDYACLIRQLWLQTRAMTTHSVSAVQALSAEDAASAFAHAASRPAWSVLDCQRLHALGIVCAPWLPALRRVIAAIG